jgi:hypothetical protein
VLYSFGAFVEPSRTQLVAFLLSGSLPGITTQHVLPLPSWSPAWRSGRGW